MKIQVKHLIFVALLVVCSCDGDKKPKKHDDHPPIKEAHYEHGEHNEDYDHQAILGSEQEAEEFSKLDAAEAKDRLENLAKEKIDLNKDSLIDENELTHHILKSFVKLDDSEAQVRFGETDADSDDVLSWKEYMQETYGMTEEELQEQAKTDKDKKNMLNDILIEKSRFQLADKNNDQTLDRKEFNAFYHPFNYEYMHENEINNTFKFHDKNKDGFITFDEYSDENAEKETVEYDKEHFKQYDKDSNGKLDRKEVEKWVIPDHKQLAVDEAKHLISETDANKDGKLTIDEIRDQHSLWVGSQHISLHDPEEL